MNAPAFDRSGYHVEPRRVIDPPTWEQYNRLRIDRACLAVFGVFATVVIIALCLYIVTRLYV